MLRRRPFYFASFAGLNTNNATVPLIIHSMITIEQQLLLTMKNYTLLDLFDRVFVEK